MANEITDKDKVIMENFGKRLNILLKKVNLKKKDFAERIGATDGIVSKWTKGKVNPTMTTLFEIVDFFNTNFPYTNPIQTLFPELVENEIKKVKAERNYSIYKNYKNEIDTTIKDYETKIAQMKEERKKDETLIKSAQRALHTYNKVLVLRDAICKVPISLKKQVYEYCPQEYFNDVGLY